MTNGRAVSPAVLLFLCLFAAQAALLVLSPILPAVAAEFGVSTATAGQLRSASGLVAGAVSLALIRVGRRFRLRSVLAVGLGGLVVGSVMSALAPSFAVLVVAQTLTGFGVALVLSGGLAASEAWSAGEERSRALSWALVGQPVAWIVGQPIAGVVADIDWRWAWIAVPTVAGGVALLAVLTRCPDGEARETAEPGGVFRQHGAGGWALGELLAFSAWAGVIVFAGALMIETYAIGAGTAGLLLGAGAAAYLPGNFLARRWLAGSGRHLLVGFALALAVGAVLLGAVRSALWLTWVVFAVLAFLGGGRTIAGAAVGLELSRGRRMAAMSLRTAALQFGYLIGSTVGGAALAWRGYAAVGLAYGGLLVLAVVPHLAALRTSREHEPTPVATA